MSSLLRLRDKVAIITGTAHGIGAASAMLFAKEGAAVAAIDLDAKTNAELIESVRSFGGVIERIDADIANREEVQRAVRHVLKRYGTVDILFNNAGIVPPTGMLHELDEAGWSRTMNVNLTSIYLFCAEVIPIFLVKRQGVILNTSSATALRTVPGRAAYTASKSAVLGLTRSIAIDYAKEGIRANCLCPGTIDTHSLRERIALSSDPELARQRFIERQPMQRIGRPEDVAMAALFLASDEASFVTGVAFAVDGGMSL